MNRFQPICSTSLTATAPAPHARCRTSRGQRSLGIKFVESNQKQQGHNTLPECVPPSDATQSKAEDRRKRFSHSAYTKRRYKHVTSKVAKYITDIEAQDEKSRRAKENLLRNNSMPEYQAEPSDAKERGHFSVDELFAVDLSVANDSANICERLISEIERHRKEIVRLQEENLRVQSYSDYLQTKLDEKAMQTLIMKRNLETIRIEMECYRHKLRKYESA
ncbi:blast:Protein swallow [Drosophila guanche]|uniref:Blast:Protein swallow n=1 Tax=Drosophila guanche TaxID=7266 RepID=A0A3B0JR87_DROGU|nr:blast:Protein swallow [Drosophila guanche]